MKRHGAGTTNEDIQLGYLLCKVEGQLEGIARSTGGTSVELAARFADLLTNVTAAQVRETLGNSQYVRPLRRKTTKARKAVATKKVALSTHANGTRVSTSAKGFKYEPGTHWMQKPENKARLKKMMKGRMETRLANLAKKKAAATGKAAA